MHLILYTKTGCHLCEGLQSKIEQISDLDIHLELREINTNSEWFDRYQYEVPVLYLDTEDELLLLPRLSPRSSVDGVRQMLINYSPL
jgi:hypothetical protein